MGNFMGEVVQPFPKKDTTSGNQAGSLNQRQLKQH